jgi:hypothetical protein
MYPVFVFAAMFVYVTVALQLNKYESFPALPAPGFAGGYLLPYRAVLIPVLTEFLLQQSFVANLAKLFPSSIDQSACYKIWGSEGELFYLLSARDSSIDSKNVRRQCVS